MLATLGRLLPLLIVLAVMAVPVSSHGAESTVGEDFFKDDPREPWHITADEISQDRATGAYLAHGNVVITKQGRRLTADRVRFDQKNDRLYADGHVILTSGEDLLTGEKLTLNLSDETGTTTNGTVFLSQNHFYISGETIQKTGKDTYEVEKATLTACDGPSPAWRLTGRKLNITIEGFGTATHATLWAKKIPVMYTPALIFPVKVKRQTGFLPPQLGRSERKWEEYEQPFFWAINDSSDATFTLHHMGRRGEKFGVEYRYVLDEQSKGTVMVDTLYDRKVDEGPISNSEWGYTDDALLRPNNDRYWLRMKHDQTLAGNVTVKLDLDVVSDQDYLHEFRGGYTGFDQADDYFTETFGRDLDDYDDAVRLNTLTLNKTWTGFSLNASTIWYDDVVKRRQGLADNTLQQLPKVELDASRQTLFGSPFYATLDSDYTYFYRETGMRGQRVDAHPRAYLPLKVGHYLNFEPSLGVRETAWYIDTHETATAGDKEKALTREAYDVKLDLSSEVYRIFPGFGDSIKAIRHTARPQVVYDYTPHMVQDKFPYFDATDRLAAANLITYSLTNTLTAKSVRPGPTGTGTETNAETTETAAPAVPEAYDYSEFTRFKLTQSYDINKDRADDPQPFSNIIAELDVLPASFFSIRADAAWSQYEREFVTRNVGLNLWDDRGDRVSVEHRYSQATSETVFASALVKVSDRISSYIDQERNLFTGNDISTRVGLLYEAQCWSIDVRYTNEGEDRTYAFLVTLYGIGDIGTNIAGRRMEDPLKFTENNP
ncbi:MAG: LPS-assembly protein LptD [Desulfobacterales bacterium]|nr:LPS-assembly protein LptD [Desulfobacterales bacterium]